jgi:hypothetical protein
VLTHVFDNARRTAVAGAFKLAGYSGPQLTAPVDSEDERALLLEPDVFQQLRDARTLEQVVQQLLGRKLFVASATTPGDRRFPSSE